MARVDILLRHNEIKQWCKKYNLPYRYNDIKELKSTHP